MTSTCQKVPKLSEVPLIDVREACALPPLFKPLAMAQTEGFVLSLIRQADVVEPCRPLDDVRQEPSVFQEVTRRLRKRAELVMKPGFAAVVRRTV